MRNSQYLSDYLSGNKARGEGNGLTIGSYLSYVLRGKAKQYSGSYVRALRNSCERVGAIEGRSKLGGVAFYPPDSL
jgi:hypothetical protein